MSDIVKLIENFWTKPFGLVLRLLRVICTAVMLLEYVAYKNNFVIPIDLKMDTVYFEQFMPFFTWGNIVALIILAILYTVSENFLTNFRMYHNSTSDKETAAAWGTGQDLMGIIWTLNYCVLTLGYSSLFGCQKLFEDQYSPMSIVLLIYAGFTGIVWLLICLYSRNYKY